MHAATLDLLLAVAEDAASRGPKRIAPGGSHPGPEKAAGRRPGQQIHMKTNFNVTYSREDSTISATLPLAVIGLRVITVVMIGRALAEAVVEVGIAIAV